MKSLLLIFFFMSASSLFAQDSLEIIADLQRKVIEQQILIDDYEKASTDEMEPVEESCIDCKPELGWTWLFVLMPVILSLIIGLFFLNWLKREGYKISNALSEDIPESRLEEFQNVEIQMVQSRAEAFRAGIMPEKPTTESIIPEMDPNSLPINRSSSRLIAFLSSLSAAVLAVCLFSYYMYFAIKGMEVPDFEDLWTILATLGIGVVPYATKVISGK